VNSPSLYYESVTRLQGFAAIRCIAQAAPSAQLAEWDHSHLESYVVLDLSTHKCGKYKHKVYKGRFTFSHIILLSQ